MSVEKRILVTIAGGTVYVAGRWIPLPGVDRQGVLDYLGGSPSASWGPLNIDLAKSSVFSLGVRPFILGSVLILLLTAAIPRLRQLRDGPARTGDALERSIYGATIVIALIQGWGLALILQLIPRAVVLGPGALFRIQTTATLVAGSVFLAWMAGQITRRGVVNGVALIVLVNYLIAASSGLKGEVAALTSGARPLRTALVFLIGLGWLFYASLLMVRAEHRIPIEPVEDSTWSRPEATKVPSVVLRANTVGVMPIAVASIVMLPLTYVFASVHSTARWLVYCALIVLFTYWLTAVSFSGADVVEQLRRHGFRLAEVHSGISEADFIDRLVERLVMRHTAFLVALVLVGPFVVTRLDIARPLSDLAGPSLLVVAAITVAIVERGRALRDHDWVPVFEGDTELETELVRARLNGAGIPARRVSNRAIPITGTLAFWETSRPPYPSLTIYRRLGGGGVYAEVPPEYSQKAETVLAAMASAGHRS